MTQPILRLIDSACFHAFVFLLLFLLKNFFFSSENFQFLFKWKPEAYDIIYELSPKSVTNFSPRETLFSTEKGDRPTFIT